MGNPNLIEVTGVANEVIDCDKFNKSISIYKCKGEKGKAGKIEVNGKCNSLMLDNCERIDLHVDSVMSTVEISNCQRVKLFMKPGANVLSVVIDKTDGCLITLSKESQANPDFQVIAAKSSEMNLAFDEGDEKVEKPVPEQFVFKIDRSGGKAKITSSVSDLYN
mmetsp:Transcript_14208/g.25453  ORF Transcript_14208/g.25453 Transcript_14208/m.25453 type:complete len:164 (+) Transcript_14208:100-591(+)|eukprot:CAMPEP_0184518052 /NCGR_PEP_ID=MMETSP0198_2-20121128/5881_1 /TAXON_ID=1112570 /ORGANISM="Thraustochytrium sp., Strain LLF1b" /LENGTH=163 /DNA_ID=CAMNT_0026908463 /DNA_START=88 /DNA_END=579 /DNA_ORIENTATION=-